MLVQPVSTTSHQEPLTGVSSTHHLPIEAHAVASTPFTAMGTGFEASPMPATTDYAQRVASAANLG